MIVIDLIKTVFKLLEAVNDYLTLVFGKVKKGDTFSFLVHPRDITDIYRPYPFLRFLPSSWVLRFVKVLPPITLSRITGLKALKENKRIDGWLLSIVLTPDQMKEDPKFAVKKVIQLAKLARKKGSQIAGLGALIPYLTKHGVILINEVDGMGITTGHAYTAWVILQYVLRTVQLFDLPADAQIAVVGAAGSMGSICTQLFARNKFENLLLIDISRNEGVLAKTKNSINEISLKTHVSISTKLEALKSADVIVSVTNAPRAIIQPEHLKEGAIVIDDAQPQNVSDDVISNRDDVLVIKVLAHTPGINPHFDFGLPCQDDVFTCLAETMALTAIGWDKHFTIGRVAENQVFKIAEIAEKVGFSAAGFTTYNRLIDERDIERIQKIRQKEE
jgi:predicted amino acid dehydrogenase